MPNEEFKVLGSFGQKFKLGGVKNSGHTCTNCPVSQKVQTLGDRSFLMKCFVLFGWLSGGI